MNAQVATLLQPDAAGLARAAEILTQGGLVSFPTETVYGLGADARNDRAVAAIFAAKGRPSFNPLIVHLGDIAAAHAICDFNGDARCLAAAFWPGALTLVLPLRPQAGISRLVTAGLDSIALRVPDHKVAQGLLAAFGGPVAAPSANPSGRISPTTAAHVRDGLGDRIDALVDGGPCAVGLESTIVACLGAPTLLRAGGIPAEAIAACLGRPLATSENPDAPVSPGQLLSHYAPIGQVRLNATARQSGPIRAIVVVTLPPFMASDMHPAPAVTLQAWADQQSIPCTHLTYAALLSDVSDAPKSEAALRQRGFTPSCLPEILAIIALQQLVAAQEGNG
jgi:L-threonylcarbamoyladenylate synthase